MNRLGKQQKTGIHSGQRAQFRQDFGMFRLESSGSDCSMGASSRENSVNSAYTHLIVSCWFPRRFMNAWQLHILAMDILY